MSYIVSWSGGKESCLACYEAISEGYKVSHLVNFISDEFKRVSFHGTEAKLVQLQSQSIGIPLLQKETTLTSYENEFKEAVQSLIPNGVKGMIFGDLYVEEHRDWVERVCGDLGIEAVLPLWGKNPEEVFSKFIDVGFEAVIVSAQSKLIEENWIGRVVDRNFMAYLRDRNIDLCGENGEYHTLVVNGPIFKRPIQLIETRTIVRDNHWLLDTVKYQLGR